MGSSILVGPPSDPTFGDLYTNAAMVFAKVLKKPPLQIAESICKSLESDKNVLSSCIASPGFVNLRMKKEFWQNVVNVILNKKCEFSFLDIKHGSRINVEFVSANPTGPLHTGHARNAVFGDVSSNLLSKIGYKVTREFYINDYGNQINLLIKSIYARYKEALGSQTTDADFTDGMYFGEYIKDLAGCLIDKYGESLLSLDECETSILIKSFTISKLLENIKEDLKDIGIAMDKYTSETSLYEKNIIDEALKILDESGDIYVGCLPRPKGISDDAEWDERPQTLFRSTKYGDDIDRVVKKYDGTPTYFAGDLAYHLDKIKREYAEMIAVLGADHGGYVKRLQAAVKALSHGSSTLDVKLYQLVNFLEDGKPVRMSKRSGTFITMKDVVNKVGRDVARYMMISKHHDSVIDFDFAKVVEASMDNPLFYIQYAYARICSVFRHYKTVFDELVDADLMGCDKSVLSDDSEISLLKELSFWPERVTSAAIAIEPHRIVTHLGCVAYRFHALWNKGKSNAELRFISPSNKEETLSRLSLLESTRIVLEDGLNIIGVTPMSEMR
jgi:arginyl-tRNA synthetase